MAIFTVHAPPLKRSEPRRGPDRFRFVRDGFHFWAFLLPPVWMLRHGLWLVLLGFVVLTAALQFGLAALGASDPARFLAQALLGILVGLEAATMRRWTLRRGGWREASVVSGKDRDTAERRFFDAWSGSGGDTRSGSSLALPTGRAAATRHASPARSDIVGLFPEPGSPR